MIKRCLKKKKSKKCLKPRIFGDLVAYHSLSLYMCIVYIWVNNNDLTATSLRVMVSRGDYPQMTSFQVSELL